MRCDLAMRFGDVKFLTMSLTLQRIRIQRVLGDKASAGTFSRMTVGRMTNDIHQNDK
jgi:hypothetical protein